jgi:CxC2 like cysteine cluster associated with KDZ transposases
MPELQVCSVRVEVLRLLSCTCALQGVLPKVTPAASFSPSSKMGGKLLYSIVVAGGWGALGIWALWGSMPESNGVLRSFLYYKICLKPQLQMAFDYGEEYESSTDDSLGNEYPAAADQGEIQLGFGGFKPRENDTNGDAVITIIDRSGIHEIGVRWCCCFDAPERDMQLMTAGLFPATFRNPKTAFTFRVLEEFHLDNLECKTTPSQFFSRLRRLTNDEFPKTVPVGQAHICR